MPQEEPLRLVRGVIDERVSDEFANKRKVASRLCFGSVLALTGLFLSLGMLLYRTTCDVRHNVGMYTVHNGTRQMCKNPPEIHVLDSWEQVNAGINGKANEMRFDNDCRVDADCEGLIDTPTFCAGGPGDVFQDGYCLETGDCKCQSMIFDCGFRHEFPWTVIFHEYAPRCTTAPFCSTPQEVNIPFWKLERSSLPWGCEEFRKTEIKDVMILMQEFMQTNAVTVGLKAEDDPIWNPLRGILASSPDIETGIFWPSTISESVSATAEPESRIFLGFMITGAICLFASDYVSNIPSVDVPQKKISCLGMVIHWNTLRWLLVPVGLILLAEVPMKPTSQIFNIIDLIMTGVHLTGAQFCFVVYLLCEFASLNDRENRSEMTESEMKIRIVLLVVGSIAMATFGLMYVILFFFSGSEDIPFVRPPFSGNSDLYKKDEVLAHSNLVRAAEGSWLGIKVTCYVAEYVLAMSILLSHVVIWRNFSRQLEGKGDRGLRLNGEEEYEWSDEESN